MRHVDITTDHTSAACSRNQRRGALSLLLVAAGLAQASCVVSSEESESVAEAASPITIFQTANPDPEPGDQLGQSVGVADGNFAVVGAPYRTGTGVAYVYKDLLQASPITYQQKITPPAGSAGDRFGQAVAISDWVSGGCIAVAAPGHASSRGIVYIYMFNTATQTWGLHSQVEPANGAAGDQFGFSVDISCGVEPYLLVGAPYHTWAANPGQGAAYGYKWNGTAWQLENVVKAPDGAADDHFGWKVKLGGAQDDTATYAFIGAPDDDGTQTNQGSVYVFRQPGFWTYKAKIVAPDPTLNARFGLSLDQEQATHRLVVGSPGATIKAVAGAGAVYEMTGTQTTWTHVKKHFLLAAAAGDQFGASVATNESEMAVGAPGGLGKVHHYKMNGTPTYVLQGSASNPSGTVDGFGQSVAAGGHGNYCFIGAPFADLSGATNSGAMYIASF